MSESLDRRSLMILAGIVEGGLAVLALLLGWFTDISPISEVRLGWQPLLIGSLATIPLLAFFFVCYRLPIRAFQRVKELLLEMLKPMLSECRWYDIVLLALMAGVCEELFFRGFLEPWIASHFGLATGIILGAIVFGIVHCVTPTYAVLAALISVYLSFSGWFTGERNLLVPITAHAVYDYIGFLVLMKSAKDAARFEVGEDKPPTKSEA